MPTLDEFLAVIKRFNWIKQISSQVADSHKKVEGEISIEEFLKALEQKLKRQGKIGI